MLLYRLWIKFETFILHQILIPTLTFKLKNYRLLNCEQYFIIFQEADAKIPSRSSLMKYSGKFIARNLKILCKNHIKDSTFSHIHLPADDWLLIDRTRTYQHTCKNTLHVNQKSVTLMSRTSTSRDNIQVNLIQRANWSNNNNVSQPIVSIDSDYHRWIYVYDPSSKLKH